jgi:hypothetical protein
MEDWAQTDLYQGTSLLVQVEAPAFMPGSVAFKARERGIKNEEGFSP